MTEKTAIRLNQKALHAAVAAYFAKFDSNDANHIKAVEAAVAAYLSDAPAAEAALALQAEIKRLRGILRELRAVHADAGDLLASGETTT